MSSIVQEFRSKLHQKLVADEKTLQEKFGHSWFQNHRHDAILEIAAEHTPIILDPKTDIRTRVNALNELIHATALFSGRIRQNPWFGSMMFHWERLYGSWTNMAILDMKNLLPQENDIPDFIYIELEDKTWIKVNNLQKYFGRLNSVIDEEDQELRLTLFAQTEVMPYGWMVYDVGVSDDTDISPQYVYSMTSSQPSSTRSSITEDELSGPKK